MKKLNIGAIFLVLAIIFSSCTGGEQAMIGGESSADEKEIKGQASVVDDVSNKNIVQIAIGSADHSTLVAAIQAAGLADVLANNGPLTVFAPTNEAFEALPEGTVENLLKPENKSQLVGLIYYHAAPGTYKGDLLIDGMQIYMAQGDNSEIKVGEDGKVTVNGANVLATIEATNGVVHVIDKVLLPPEK